MYEINWDPVSIMENSMDIIEEHMKGVELPYHEKTVVKRVIHTTGDPSLVDKVRFSPGGVEKGVALLKKGCYIYTDVNMVLCGISSRLADKFGAEVRCDIALPEAAQKAREESITRAAAALRLNAGKLDGQMVVVGNAPTALFELLSLAEKGICVPALVVGVPVGFVGAKESKDALVDSSLNYITLPGTRGGSPIAAATVNALLNLANEV